jgi:hypothetical protein
MPPCPYLPIQKHHSRSSATGPTFYSRKSESVFIPQPLTATVDLLLASSRVCLRARFWFKWHPPSGRDLLEPKNASLKVGTTLARQTNIVLTLTQKTAGAGGLWPSGEGGYKPKSKLLEILKKFVAWNRAADALAARFYFAFSCVGDGLLFLPRRSSALAKIARISTPFRSHVYWLAVTAAFSAILSLCSGCS